MYVCMYACIHIYKTNNSLHKNVLNTSTSKGANERRRFVENGLEIDDELLSALNKIRATWAQKLSQISRYFFSNNDNRMMFIQIINVWNILNVILFCFIYFYFFYISDNSNTFFISLFNFKSDLVRLCIFFFTWLTTDSILDEIKYSHKSNTMVKSLDEVYHIYPPSPKQS